MEKIKKLYEETVNENIADLEKILKEDIGVNNPEIMKQITSLLNTSSQNLTAKWLSGRKYARTFFVKKAFPNYPSDIEKISISVDAIINLLDDILDEKMDRECKALYLVELIRILSIYNYQNFEKNIQNAIGNYFNKIISIAILEEVYKNLIKNNTAFNIISNLSIQIYDCRSLDMDIYVEIPFLKLYNQNNEKNKIVKIARIFRALNLIKKDIDDIQHDKENNTETVITLISDKTNFNDFIINFIEHYKSEAKKINSNNSDFKIIIKNFNDMIENEISEINKKITS